MPTEGKAAKPTPMPDAEEPEISDSLSKEQLLLFLKDKEPSFSELPEDAPDAKPLDGGRQFAQRRRQQSELRQTAATKPARAKLELAEAKRKRGEERRLAEARVGNIAKQEEVPPPVFIPPDYFSAPDEGQWLESAPSGTELGALAGEPMPTTKPSPQSEIDRIFETMRLGNIAFNAPQSLNLRETAQIQLLLSLEQSIEELRSAITAAGETEGHKIKVSTLMEARLTGPNFQITAITPEEQAITSAGVTEWKWEVKPTIRGRHYLHLTVTALFQVSGPPTRRALRTFDKIIEVQVSWGQRGSEFLHNNWQWLWATILIPLAGLLGKKRKNRLIIEI